MKYESSAVEHYGSQWLFDETLDDLEPLMYTTLPSFLPLCLTPSSAFSLWHKTCLFQFCAITVPSCSERCPLPPPFMCVENVTELWPHHKHIFLFRFFILSDETPWPSGAVGLPHVLGESGKTNLLGLTWARQAFCWGSGTEQCQLITGWWILPPTAHLSARLPPPRPGTDGEVRKFWQLRPCWAKCKTKD